MATHVNEMAPPPSRFVNPLDATVGFQLRRTTTAISAALSDALAKCGIKASEAMLLLMIGRNPGCTQTDISRAMRAHAANLVPLINGLEQAGYVVRAPGKGRAIALTLNDEGQAMHDQVAQLFAEHEARLTRNIAPERVPDVIALLQQICMDICCTDDGASVYRGLGLNQP